MSQIQIERGEVKNSCFVVMPFSALFQTEYEKIIQPAIEELNIECIRGDEIYSKQRIVDDIWNSIRQCRFVLAELTGKNPNVLYEIGLAHAIGKPIIIITRNEDDVPFDLKSLRYLFYDVNDPFWGDNLKTGIQSLMMKILENPEIENYLDGITLPETTYPTPQKSKRITQLVDFDISGSWLGEYLDFQENKNKVTLQIRQENESIFGSTIITYEYKNASSVVQQLMNGIIHDESQIEMHGVNYTFVERGNSTDYALDSFELKYDRKQDVLIGEIVSNLDIKPNHKTTIKFTKLTDS